MHRPGLFCWGGRVTCIVIPAGAAQLRRAGTQELRVPLLEPLGSGSRALRVSGMTINGANRAEDMISLSDQRMLSGML
jgi:hypothetical protein